MPAFAVGRTQVMLYYLKKLMEEKKIPEIPVIIDSPMAIKATQVTLKNPGEYDEEAQTIYSKDGSLLSMPQITYTQTADESRAINFMQGPLIIISASGMADAGRVLHHLKHNLWRSDSTVLFAGFQAEGSLGRRLINGDKKVRIMGEDIAVKAKIHYLEGFSAHADKDQLLDWFKAMERRPQAFFVVHGEHDAAFSFAEELQRNLGTATAIPQYGDAVIIEGTEWRMETSRLIPEEQPEGLELRESLRKFERDVALYKTRIEQIALRDPAKTAEIRRKLQKAKKYVDEMLKNV